MMNPFIIQRPKAIIPLLDGTMKQVQSCRECRYRCVIHGPAEKRHVCERSRRGETYKQIKNINIIPDDCLYVVKAG